MNKKAILCLAPLLLAVAPEVASAHTTTVPVTVFQFMGVTEVQGMMGSAYHSSGDTVQRIGCSMEWDLSIGQGDQTTVTCSATDKNNNAYSCTAQNIPTFVTALAAMTSDAQITFGYNGVGSSGTCTSIDVAVYSNNQAK
jgi:hypothetical protein